jgi:hypothetical protein
MLNKKLLSAAVQAAVGPSTDANFKQTVLLLHGDGTNGAQNNTFVDGSSNNFSITRNGNTTQGTFTPFSQPAGYWSNYFDGSGDYFSIADNAAWTIDTDYTIEFWAYANSFPGAFNQIVNQRGSDTNYWTLNWNTTNGWGFYYNNGSGEVSFTRNQNSPLNKWVHVAIVKSGTTGYIFLDGQQAGATFTFPSLNNFAGSLLIGAWPHPSPGDFWHGYISNLRFVKGSAVYTSAFTPSTTPLTAITNTSLLTCQDNRFRDNSANNFAITRNGDVRVTAFSPFAPTAAYSPSVNGGSGYFDGSGDFLNFTPGSSLTFGTGDFTIEYYCYFTDASIAQTRMGFSQSGSPAWYINTNGTVAFTNYATSVILTSSNACQPNAWNHVAITRSGSTLRIFVNGVSGGSATNTTNWGNGTNVFRVMSSSGSDFSSGWLSELRILKGTALYTSDFTPPTAPLSAITNTSLLLNFTNAGIIDSTGKNVLETVGNAQIDTTVKKYGTGSMEFDGTGDYLFVPSNIDTTFGTGDFTIEFWLRSDASGVKVLLDFLSGSSNPQLYTNGTTLAWFAASADRITATSALVANTWQFITIARSSGSTKMYVDGTQVGSTYTDTNNYATPLSSIGGRAAGNSLNGYIDDLRITKGVARYTANFTPPTAPFEDL